jgi:hypothetical protein
MSDQPARRRRLHDPNATREAREENARQEAYATLLHDSLSPEERAKVEEYYRWTDEVVRQAEDRLAAVRLTPKENALVQALGGAYLLYAGALNGREVGSVWAETVPRLLDQLYGLKWNRLGGRARKRMLGRLRVLRCRANAKLGELSLKVIPCLTQHTDTEECLGLLLVRTDVYDQRQGKECASRRLPKARVQELARNLGLTNEPPRDGARRLQAVPACVAFLRQRLASGPLESRRVLRECRDRGFRPSTVKNARRRLRIVATHGEGYGANGEWWLSLPGRP